MRTPFNLCKSRGYRIFILYLAIISINILSIALFSHRAAAQVSTGIAPTLIPSGGVAIEGDLLARIPTSPPPFTSSVGDFLVNPTAPGTGGGVFSNPGGVPLYSFAFHVIDGYSASPSSPTPDVNIFTQGSKFNMDPNDWVWTSGKPPQKDDMNHALFFFSEDALGHIWFVGGGDRLATNGTSYIDFELLQNPMYKNADGTFTSYGPDGGRTVGDLVITVDYSNGGSSAGALVYRWTETSSGVFSYQTFTPAPNTVLAASNINGPVSVPFGAFGLFIYPQYAYAEVACDLNALIPGLDNCIGIATVSIKTKSSNALTATLKDLMEPIQVNLGTIPIVDIVPATQSICVTQSATLTANVTFPLTGPFTYAWTSIPAGFTSTSSTITVSPVVTTQYILLVTGPNECTSIPDTAIVNVGQDPDCSITGADGPVCTSSSNVYSAPEGMTTYAWSITGNGTISGASDGQTVTVIAGMDCGASFVLSLTITSDIGCTSTCTKEVIANDTQAPTITGVGGPLTIQCPAAPVFSTPTATDLCDAAPILTFADVTTPGICPEEYSVTRTWTATDHCGNSSTAFQIITVEDNTAPVLTNLPVDIFAECGEEIIIAYPSAEDACDIEPVVNFSRSDGGNWGDPFEPGTTTQVCFWATDDCGNISDNQCIDVTVIECPAEYCTLTQGFYGNAGGTFCNGMGTAALIESLLAQSDLVVGSNGNTMTFVPGNAECIIDLLPGGGPANTITGANTCLSHPGIQIKNGRINNILLAQTITLGLNLRLSSELGDLNIYSDTLYTASSSGCGQEGDTITSGWSISTIPLSVYNVLSLNGTIVPTVWDLYALANLALGGGNIGATTLADISSAVDAINTGFDECRFGYFQQAVPLQSSLAPPSGANQSNPDLDLVSLNSRPNPFKSSTSITFSVPVSGHVKVDVYTLTGMRVATLYDNIADADIVYNVEYKGRPQINQATYICVINTILGSKYQRILMVR